MERLKKGRELRGHRARGDAEKKRGSRGDAETQRDGMGNERERIRIRSFYIL